MRRMAVKAKNRGGRPEVKWTEKDIAVFKNLCAQFNTEEDICAVMGVSDKTLVNLINKYLYEDITGHKRRGTAKKIGFSEAFEKYSANGRSSLRRQQFKAAMDGNTTMLIWMGKQHLGQSDEPAREQAGDEAPMFYFDPGDMDG